MKCLKFFLFILALSSFSFSQYDSIAHLDSCVAWEKKIGEKWIDSETVSKWDLLMYDKVTPQYILIYKKPTEMVGKNIKIWVEEINLKSVQKSLMQFNNNKLRYLTSILYDLNGKVIIQYPCTKKWQDIVPGTVGEKLYEWVSDSVQIKEWRETRGAGIGLFVP
jgi:hypothetical protein